MPAPSLDELRAEVARTDARIVDEIVRRLALVREIGQLKARDGLPLRDYSVEREVLGRWTKGLAPAAVPEERAEVLVRWFLEESVRAQETVVRGESLSARGRDVAVVGGLGQMGRWLAEFFAGSGCRVTVVDPRPPPERFPYRVGRDLARTAADAEFVVVATPMRKAPAVYRELLATETEATIFDILSVKAPIVPWLHRGVDRGYHLASAHPLFGPSTRSLLGRRMLVLDCGDPKATAAVERLFARSSLRIARLPLDAHDRLMASVLGLPHLVALLFGDALARGGTEPEALDAGATTSFLRLAEVARLVTAENPELVADLQLLNPGTPALLDRLAASVQGIREALGTGRPPAYAGVLARAREALERTGG